MERFLKPQNDLLSRQGSIKIKALIIKLFCSYMSYYSSLTERGLQPDRSEKIERWVIL